MRTGWDGITVEWNLAPSRAGERVEGEPEDTQDAKDAYFELRSAGVRIVKSKVKGQSVHRMSRYLQFLTEMGNTETR